MQFVKTFHDYSLAELRDYIDWLGRPERRERAAEARQASADTSTWEAA